jgi:hypothetical protein
VSKLLRLRFMKLRKVLCFHSGTKNLQFLLLYDITLVGNWLLTFREKVGILFIKDQNDEDDSALRKHNHHFSSKSSENNSPMKRGCNHTFGCTDDEMGRSCGTPDR